MNNNMSFGELLEEIEMAYHLECSDNERLRDTNQALERDIYNAEMNLKHITAELAESQRRERAAVEDLSGHCEYCAYRSDCAKHDNSDPDAGFTWWTNCEDWDWRGPVDEKGEG